MRANVTRNNRLRHRVATRISDSRRLLTTSSSSLRFRCDYADARTEASAGSPRGRSRRREYRRGKGYYRRETSGNEVTEAPLIIFTLDGAPRRDEDLFVRPGFPPMAVGHLHGMNDTESCTLPPPPPFHISLGRENEDGGTDRETSSAKSCYHSGRVAVAAAATLPRAPARMLRRGYPSSRSFVPPIIHGQSY